MDARIYKQAVQNTNKQYYIVIVTEQANESKNKCTNKYIE